MIFCKKKHCMYGCSWTAWKQGTCTLPVQIEAEKRSNLVQKDAWWERETRRVPYCTSIPLIHVHVPVNCVEQIYSRYYSSCPSFALSLCTTCTSLMRKVWFHTHTHTLTRGTGSMSPQEISKINVLILILRHSGGTHVHVLL